MIQITVITTDKGFSLTLTVADTDKGVTTVKGSTTSAQMYIIVPLLSFTNVRIEYHF